MILQVEPMDLGEDLRAIGLELTEDAEGEPVRAEDGAPVWASALPALAGAEPWTIDFFGDVDRFRNFCEEHAIPFRRVSSLIVAFPPATDGLIALCKRFGSNTFGVRAGERIEAPDSTLEADIASHGLDAYHTGYSNYCFCGICDFENGSLVVLSDSLWASEVARRIRPVLRESQVNVQIAP